MTVSAVENLDGKFRIAPSSMVPDSIIELNESDLVAHEPSLVSPMPAGFMNSFTRDQIIDLIAFLTVRRESTSIGLRKVGNVWRLRRGRELPVFD